MPQENIIMGRVFGARITKMSEVTEESETVTVQGGIISMDVRERKNGGFIVQCYVTDPQQHPANKAFPKSRE